MLLPISLATRVKYIVGIASGVSPRNKWTAPLLGGLLVITGGIGFFSYKAGQLIYNDIKERINNEETS